MSQHRVRKVIPSTPHRGSESKSLSSGSIHQSVVDTPTTRNSPDYVPQKRVVKAVVHALEDSVKEGNIPTMAREREIVGAIRQVGVDLPLRRVYTVEERKAALLEGITSAVKKEAILEKYGVSLRTQTDDRTKLRDILGFKDVSSFHSFCSDSTNYGMLEETIADMVFPLGGFQNQVLEEQPGTKRVRYKEAKVGTPEYYSLIRSAAAYFHEKSMIAAARESAVQRAEEAEARKVFIPRAALTCLPAGIEERNEHAMEEDEASGLPNTGTGHQHQTLARERAGPQKKSRLAEEEVTRKENRMVKSRQNRMILENTWHTLRTKLLTDPSLDWRCETLSNLKAAFTCLPKSTAVVDPHIKRNTKAWYVAMLEEPMMTALAAHMPPSV